MLRYHATDNAFIAINIHMIGWRRVKIFIVDEIIERN